MPTFLSPSTQVATVSKGPVVPVGVITDDVGGIWGSTPMGPVNVPTLITDPSQYDRIFGSYELSGQFMRHAAQYFLTNGGTQIYVNRIAADDALPGAVTLFATGGAAAASAQSQAFPVPLPAGTSVSGKVNTVTATGFTIEATPASVTGASATFGAGGTGDSVSLSVNGINGIVTVDLHAVTSGLQSYLDAFHAQVVGLKVNSSGGQIQLVTERNGSGAGATILALGGNAAATTGLSVGAFANAGPNNVADDRNVTAAEFTSLWNTGFAGTTATAVGANEVKIQSGTTGTGASFQILGPTNIGSIAPGLTTSVVSGSATGGVGTLVAQASSPGAWSLNYRIQATRLTSNLTLTGTVAGGSTNRLLVNAAQRFSLGDVISVTQGGDTERASVQSIDGSTLVLSTPITVPSGGYAGAQVVREQVQINVYDANNNLALSKTGSMSPLAGANYIVNLVNNTITTPVFLTDLTPNVSDPRPVTDAVGHYFNGGTDGSGVQDADLLGDSTAKTGIYAINQVANCNIVTMPGCVSVAAISAFSSLAQSTENFMFIPDYPQGSSPSQFATFITTTCDLANSETAAYFGWPQVFDQASNGLIYLPPSMFAMTIYARVSRTRTFAKAPAGMVDGLLPNVVGLDYSISQSEYDTIYVPQNLNAIMFFEGVGTCIFGSRTLDPTGEFGQVGTRRIFNKARRYVLKATRGLTFEDADQDTWDQCRRILTLEFRQWRVDGVLRGSSDQEAFFIICDATNNNVLVQDADQLVCRYGLAIKKPVEFQYYTQEIDTRAEDALLAASLAQTGS